MKILMRTLVRDKTIPYHYTPQKNFEPISTAGFLAGTLGSSVLGGLFGLFGGDNTNETNWNIAKLNYQSQQETNKLNFRANAANNLMNQMIAREYNSNQLQLQNEMNEFNRQMWQENNAYNSPYNQLKLAEAAGLNPNMAFGITPASSPVQQTSIPSQQMAQMNSYRAESPKLDYQKQYSALKELGKLLEALPQNAVALESGRLDNQRKRIENDIRKFELESLADEDKIFKSTGFVQGHDGTVITADEYSHLSDKDKENFISPVGYRHMISDKLISADDYKSVPDSDKKYYNPYYDYNVSPGFQKFPFSSKRAYETWKSLQSVGQVLSNIRADEAQNKLRSLVANGQLKRTDVIDAFIGLPAYTANKLLQDTLKVQNEVAHDIKVNENLAKRLSDQDAITEYTARKLKNELDTNVVELIKKNVPDGFFQDLLIGMVGIAREMRH